VVLGAGCGGGAGSHTILPPPDNSISAISGPNHVQIGINAPASYVYSARVTGGSDDSVIWSVSDPTIATIDAESGVMTPSVEKTGEVIVTATAHADPSKTSTLLVYVTDWILTDYNAFEMDGGGGYQGSILPLADNWEECAWSYDHLRFACIDGNADRQQAFYIFDTDGTPSGTKQSAVIDLSTVQGLGGVRAPRFSPDGTTIVFHASGISPDGLSFFHGPMTIDVSGKTSPKLVASEARLIGTAFAAPRFSPDGKQILYAQSDGLWIVNKDGSNRQRLAPAPASQGVLSPDMSTLYYESGGALYKANADGTGPVSIVPTGVKNLMDVSPNGKSLVYVGSSGNGADQGNVYLINADGSNAHLTAGWDWAAW